MAKTQKPPEPFQNSEFRTPPQDLEAEQAVLGAMMLSRDANDTVSLILEETDFYREAHRKLFRVFQTLHERKEAVDVVTVPNELKKMGEWEAVGGVSTLTMLMERVPTAANADYYAHIVKDKACARKLIQNATQIVAGAYADSDSIKEQFDKAEFLIFEATDRKETKGFVQIKDIIGDVYEEIYTTIGSENSVTGLPMGIERLDTLTRGLQPAKLYIVGARPAVGKTALVVNIAWNVASGKNPGAIKYPVGIFSIEMTEKEIGERLLCAVSGVNFSAAMDGRILEKDRARLKIASAKIYEAPIFVNDNSSLTIMELKAASRRLKKDHDIKLLVVDYLQLIRAGVHKDNREQEIAFISMNLKALAKDLNIPILVASQLSRPMKGTEGKPPTLSDLRESGAIEQDANVVIFIHKWKTKEDGIKYQLMLSKNRSGAIDEEIPINFTDFSTTFSDIDRQEVKN